MYPLQRWTAVLLFAALPSSLVGQGHPDAALCTESFPVRIMSVNLRHGQSPSGDNNVPDVAAMINKLSPDIVVLQEVDRGVRRSNGRDLALELAEATEMYFAFGETLDSYQGGSYGLLMLSRVPYVRVTDHPLPHQPNREPRIIQEAFVTMASGLSLLVFSTHLGYDDPPVLRSEQFELLQRRTREHEFDVAVLVGDLNVDKDSDEHESLLSWFADTAPMQSGSTYPANRPVTQLDHILYRSIHDVVVTRFEIVTDPVVSDHLPVWAEIEVCLAE